MTTDNTTAPSIEVLERAVEVAREAKKIAKRKFVLLTNHDTIKEWNNSEWNLGQAIDNLKQAEQALAERKAEGEK